MESKHTKGIWKVDEATDYTITVVSPWTKEVKPESEQTFGDYRGAHICEIHYNGGVPTKEQALANAILIAAAPDLLASIKISYLMLLCFMPYSLRNTTYGQIILSKHLSAIVKTTKEDDNEVQSFFESLAYSVITERENISSVILKIK